MPLGAALWSSWTTAPAGAQDYTYCLLVPVMVTYLVFDRRRQLARMAVQGSTAAIGWIILGLFLFWIGSRAGKQYIGCAGIQVLVAGIILWFWGGGVFRLFFFAWAIITFAWPLPFVDSTIAFPMRMIVSHLAYGTLNFLGMPCIQDGTALLSASDPPAGLPLGARFQIDIADPCSGLHSLLPLLMFSAFYSFFFLPLRWQQWLVFLSAIPLAIVGNVVRILMLVMGEIEWGAPFAIGTGDNPSWFHESCGFAVFVVALGFECLLGFILIRLAAASPEASAAAAKAHPPAIDARPSSATDQPAEPLGVPGWRNSIILGLALAMAIICWITPPPYLATEPGVLMALPEEVTLPEFANARFAGFDALVSEAEHRMLPPDTEFSRKNYDDFHGHNIFFSIVLSGKQQYTIHPPQVCLVAQGWTIVHEENIPIRLNSGHELVVRNLSIQRPENDPDKGPHLIHAYYMYWYVTDGISTPSRATRNWVSSWDRIIHNRDHRWAYVIAMSPITQSFLPNGLDAAQTREMLADFIRQVVPGIQKTELAAQGGSGSDR